MHAPDNHAPENPAPARRAPATAAATLVLAGIAALAGCRKDNADAPLLGTLEWDRIGVPAEASEPILRIVSERPHAARGVRDRRDTPDCLIPIHREHVAVEVADFEQPPTHQRRADVGMAETVDEPVGRHPFPSRVVEFAELGLKPVGPKSRPGVIAFLGYDPAMPVVKPTGASLGD